MSLPPQILRIKRKRVDEPVDSLYIETDSNHHKRRGTEHDFVFRRLKENDVHFAPLPAVPSGIPQVIATRPGEEINYRRPRRSELTGSSLQLNDHVDPSRPKALECDGPVSKPRRYHLSRLEAAAALQAQQTRKIRQNEEGSVAVFVEARPKSAPVNTKSSSESMVDPSDNTQTPSSTPPRKRPGRTAAVPRAPRSRDESEDPNGGNTFELHDALQKYATEESVKLEPSVNPIRSLDKKATSKPRDASGDVEMLDGDDDEDYVYDTYMRYSEVMASSSMDTTAAIGFLVIPEEDQELWEVYGEDEGDSEQDWDSEQDDENAENYYGADYPEDEVASDDEFDTGAYGYRRGRGSDDEEYDLNDDDVVESDVEDINKKFAWQGKTWRKGEAEDGAGAEEDEVGNEQEEAMEQ